MICACCGALAVASVQLRSGVEHPAHDQRDTSRLQVVPLCAEDYALVLAHVAAAVLP
jgi:hypothetical protein